MQLSGNTILVTGGASGIGFALAQRFVAAGNTVVVCGRRKNALAKVQSALPTVTTRVCDLSSAQARIAFVESLTKEFPALNVLVNNAGIQQRHDLTKTIAWESIHSELATNLEAPVHLCSLLTPHLAKQSRSVIINVTSGLAFAPLASVPVYCATKAALHSFTLSLRHQLRGTNIAVLEVQPPAVNTDLGGPGLHTFGIPVDEFADAVMVGLAGEDTEVAYGSAKESSRASRSELDAIFTRMNNR